MELKPLHIVNAQLIDGAAPRPGSLLAVDGRIAALDPTEIPDGTETAEERIAYEQWQARQLEVANKATVIIAKQRHGATGSVHMRFDRQFTKFSDLAHEEY